jgi:drug/metabolite transporter (DMT)-like permease
MASSGMSARAWWLFAAVSLLWGIPYLFIKLAVEDFSPVWVAFGRIVVAFAVLLPYAWRKGALRGLHRHWKPLLIYSIVEICLPWPLIGFGEQRVSSGLAAILIAAVPLIVALMALRVDHEERAEGSRLVGLIVGFTGVVVLLGLDVAGRPGELLGALAILLAAVGYAAGPMIIKHRFRTIDPLGPVTASMGISALVLAPAAAFSAPSAAPSADALISVVVLGLACSAAGFLLFFALIHEVGPGRATVITFVNPVVAVALGIALLGEGLGPSAVAGLLLILAGSWLSTGGRMPPGLMTRVARMPPGLMTRVAARRRGDPVAQQT